MDLIEVLNEFLLALREFLRDQQGQAGVDPSLHSDECTLKYEKVPELRH